MRESNNYLTEGLIVGFITFAGHLDQQRIFDCFIGLAKELLQPAATQPHLNEIALAKKYFIVLCAVKEI